jgi:hypothetical protein
MNTYSIVKIGSEYVVLADEQRVLKIASRRRAAKLVVNAAELLAMQSGQEAPPEQDIHQPAVISRRS